MPRNPNCKCEICNKEIYRNLNKPTKNITCSKECRKVFIQQQHGKQVICALCGKSFYKKNSKINKINFCNDECYRNYNKPKLEINEIIKLHEDGLYDKDIAKIAECSRALIVNLLNQNGFTNRRTKINNHELRARISKANTGKRTGKENHNYKGNSSFTLMARGLTRSISKQYMMKKNYMCEICGKRGGDLNTHHIKPFYIILDEFLLQNPNITKEEFAKKLLKYDEFINENNLILTCIECHRNIHYKDNSEPSPYLWEGATTIENTNQPKDKNKVD